MKFTNVFAIKKLTNRNYTISICLPRSWLIDGQFFDDNVLLKYDPVDKVITIKPTKLPIFRKPSGFGRKNEKIDIY